ncbi:MAG: 50S ribosomal protein L13 [Candidatus Levybacteria bacterium]|nr:50S ribosomal protein L13 [Candidatus Levybacteria bacterium]
MKQTQSTKLVDIKRQWHLVDLKEKTLGRISTDIAKLLMGKGKPYFVRNLDCGDYVVIINARQVKVTGKKETDKIYHRHSGYPGGKKEETLGKLRKRRPEDIIIHAVKGMLPQNKLRDRMLKRMFVFVGQEHKYNDKFKTQSSNIKSEEEGSVKVGS